MDNKLRDNINYFKTNIDLMILETLDIACLKQTGSIEFHHGRVLKINTICNPHISNLNKISVLTFFLSFF
jgi:hypothetical protein